MQWKKNINSEGSAMLEQVAWETVESLLLELLRKQMYMCSKKQMQPAPGDPARGPSEVSSSLILSVILIGKTKVSASEMNPAHWHISSSQTHSKLVLNTLKLRTSNFATLRC